MAKVYIYSTSSSDNKYESFERSANGIVTEKNSLFIAGKANVSNPKTLVTPSGMLTIVEEADYKAVESSDMFQRHLKRGFLKVSKTRVEAEDAAKDMTAKDKAAQITAAEVK